MDIRSSCMDAVFEHLHLKTRPRSWRNVIANFKAGGIQKISAAGANFYGLWVSQIGMAMNEGTLLICWPNNAPDPSSVDLITSLSDDITNATSTILHPTVKPTNDAPPKQTGVYMHRWFTVNETDWDEFLQLSADAWPDFEAATGATVIGFWRPASNGTEEVTALLVTHYPSMAAWEASRGPNTTSEQASEAWQAFVRRHEMTQSMTATAMELISFE